MKVVPLGYEEDHFRGGVKTKTKVNHLTRASRIFKPTHLKEAEGQANEEYEELGMGATKEKRKKEHEDKVKEE